MPSEEVWLQSLQSERTRKAYQKDVRDFLEALSVSSREELYAVTPAAVLEWQALLRARGVKATTIRRKLSALCVATRRLSVACAAIKLRRPHRTTGIARFRRHPGGPCRSGGMCPAERKSLP